MMMTLTELMGTISVFVSIILGFLIVYANNFLIRRRKREIGIYMILGMEKGKVAKILAAETFIIGILSLGAGLAAGVFLSQGLSVVTAKIFDVDMIGYKFIFSQEAFLKTIVYFGIIFLIVMAMSIISVSKYKLIDLVNADKQNEKPKIKNTWCSVILFILSIACIGTAYKLVLKNGIKMFDKRLLFEIILGSIGTFLFFASLSGFFLKVIQSNKKLYLKGLNMFILRQINSRINSAHISMSLICLMLFFTIGILSTGLGMTDVMNKSYKESTPYDVSFEKEGEGSIYEKFKEYGLDIYKYTDEYVEFSMYQHEDKNLTKGQILKNFNDKKLEWISDESPLYLIKVSDYNKLMKLQGKDGIDLSQNQVAVFSDYTEAVPELRAALMEFIKMKHPINISKKDYEVYPKLLTDAVVTGPVSNIVVAIVVPDDVTYKSSVFNTMISFNCNRSSNSFDAQDKLEKELISLDKKYNDKKDLMMIEGATKNVVKSMLAGTNAIIAFVGIYLGLIFLITSAAILALQQLSEAADNRSRYNILKKVGSDDKLINRALFKQIAIYFMMPLALACVHSVVGIKVANDIVKTMGHINAIGNIIITAVLILVVYGSYFTATYFSSKRIILK
jgi:putative ABC transport system permease protein